MITEPGTELLDIRLLADRLIELETADDNTEEEKEELAELLALQDQFGRSLYDQGNDYDPSLILDDYFVTYAEEFARDCGMVNEQAVWPNNCIDWETAADELRHDYTCVTYGGYYYWIRG